MRYSTASTVAFAAAAVASPLAAPQSPSTSAPAGCSPNYDGKFQIQVVNSTTVAKRNVEKRQDGKLEITLANGVLTDAQGRIGNIVANNQFQFDPAPGQAGAIYTSGWSACANGSLAIGGDAQFYQCLSGTFYNLYDEATAAQCYPVFINIVGAGAGPATAAASQLGDGQATVSGAASRPATTSAASVSVLPDGQPQAGTSQSAIATQITDGQVQASGAASYTSAAPVSQITDGQIQAGKPTASPITQISDGQIQAPGTSSASGPVATQIGDGQVQSPANGTVAPSGTGVISAPSGTGSPIAYDGAASTIHATGLGLFAVLAMAFAL